MKSCKGYIEKEAILLGYAPNYKKRKKENFLSEKWTDIQETIRLLNGS